MFEKLYEKINKRVTDYALDYISKQDLVSHTKREPRHRTPKEIKNDMIFEVDESKLEKLRLELIDAEDYHGDYNFDTTKFTTQEYPEMFI